MNFQKYFRIFDVDFIPCSSRRRCLIKFQGLGQGRRDLRSSHLESKYKGQKVNLSICHLESKYSCQQDICHLESNYSGQQDICHLESNYSGRQDICPLESNYSGQQEICHLESNYSCQQDICHLYWSTKVKHYLSTGEIYPTMIPIDYEDDQKAIFKCVWCCQMTNFLYMNFWNKICKSHMFKNWTIEI